MMLEIGGHMHIKKDRLSEKTRKSHLKCKGINIRVTEGEHARITKAAKDKGLNITQWMEVLIFGEEACK